MIQKGRMIPRVGSSAARQLYRKMPPSPQLLLFSLSILRQPQNHNGAYKTHKKWDQATDFTAENSSAEFPYLPYYIYSQLKTQLCHFPSKKKHSKGLKAQTVQIHLPETRRGLLKPLLVALSIPTECQRKPQTCRACHSLSHWVPAELPAELPAALFGQVLTGA